MAETIMIVEDEISLQETLAYNLKKEGYTVEAVGDGRSRQHGKRIAGASMVDLSCQI